ncbi:MAG: hypothetical protein H6Q70_785 [Firmicutes bacterium]|nr:hypothetical protein [Bacillota bacterium]
MKKNIGGISMSFLNCLGNSIGSVSILTDEGFIFQGQIVKNRDEDRHRDDDFILLELICNASKVTEDGEIRKITPPLYRDNDIIRINVCQIIAVGPNNGCPNNHHHDQQGPASCSL